MTAAGNQPGPGAKLPGPSSKAPRLREQTVVVWLVVLGGLLITLGTAASIVHDLTNTAHSRFRLRVERLSATALNGLQNGAETLEAARMTIERSARPPADAWRDYALTHDKADASSPVSKIEFLPATALPAAGAVEPAAAPTTTAGDELDGELAAALRRAAQTRRLALAARDAPGLPGTLAPARALVLALPLYMPAAAGSGRAGEDALAGFLLASIDPRRLFEPTGVSERNIDMRIAIGSPPVTVFEAARGAEDGGDTFQQAKTVPFGGAALTFGFASSRDVRAIGAAGPVSAVLAAGLAATVLAALACHWVARRMRAGARDGDAGLNEARLTLMLRASSDAIISVDEAQRIVIFNPAAERVFGVSAMEAIGAPLERFIPERYRAAHAQYVERFGVTGTSERQMGRQKVLCGVRANGEEFPLEASISQIRDGTGKLYTVALRDVTERVRAETMLRHSSEELRELSANLQMLREHEKMRIARELHDDLGQRVAALKMDVSAAQQALRAAAAEDSHTAAALDTLGGMQRLVDLIVASLRRIAADLRPTMLDDLGLVAALDWLTGDFTQRHGIDVDSHVDVGPAVFTDQAATAMFRIVQEALDNVARHADASLVQLRLSTAADCCRLTIADNGRGAAGRRDVQPDTARTFGLIGIRERARTLDGTVAVDTPEHGGFSLTVSFPLHAVIQDEILR
jgi:two-component system sensor histidine kinase UhpB